jgi:hypothetical protein
VAVARLDTSAFVQRNRNKCTARKKNNGREYENMYMYNWLTEVGKEIKRLCEIPPTESNGFTSFLILYPT